MDQDISSLEALILSALRKHGPQELGLLLEFCAHSQPGMPKSYVRTCVLHMQADGLVLLNDWADQGPDKALVSTATPQSSQFMQTNDPSFASVVSPMLRELAARYPIIVSELCSMSVEDARVIVRKALDALPPIAERTATLDEDSRSAEILPLAPKLATLLSMDVFTSLAESLVELNAAQSDKWDEISAAVLAPGA